MGVFFYELFDLPVGKRRVYFYDVVARRHYGFDIPVAERKDPFDNIALHRLDFAARFGLLHEGFYFPLRHPAFNLAYAHEFQNGGARLA